MKPEFPVSKALLLTTLVAVASGCSTLSGSHDAALQAKLQQLEAEKASREQALSLAEAELGELRKTTRQTAQAQGASFPPNPRPGECYTSVWVKPEYRTVSKQVLAQEGSDQIKIIPARYEKRQEKVLVQEASTRLEVVPATYKWVEEQVMVKPASKRIVEVPARYETLTEQVIDKPAHTVWKKGAVYASQSSVQKIDPASGEVMCLVEVPATYKTISKKVLKSAATTRVEETPAQYKTIKRKVVDRPASTRTIEIPARYNTINTTVVVDEAREQRVSVPERYVTVQSRELVKEGRLEWRSILCEVNATPERIRQIQRALKARGFNPGPIDGQIGPATTQAVRQFQASAQLPEDGLLTLDTVAALDRNAG